MANPEHLAILTQGVEAWKKWRLENPAIRPRLRDANLIDADLRGANLISADLRGADLRGADLRDANLIDADLRGADLSGANLRSADLSGANLRSADLTGVDLSSADLRGANLREAYVGHTTFGDADLSETKGLDTIGHCGPSTIGVDTLYRSKGKIPESFLRDAGLPDLFLTYVPSLLGGEQPIQFYSAFISYSSKDDEFARRLHDRLRGDHVRVWFAPEEIKGGRKLHEQIDEAIRVYDKLLLVLSKDSLKSEWVMTEIRKARKGEVKEGRRKLFPIRLVGMDRIKAWECFDADTGKDLAVEVREYFIPDFSQWKNHDAFEAAYKRLLRDLQAEEKIPK
jgi:uncharacterized protein YjbI with pentapeptide repeats